MSSDAVLFGLAVIFPLLVAVGVLLTCCLVSRFSHQEPKEPRRDMSRTVSDEEFLAACSVKDPDVALRVRKVLADCLGLDEHEIHPEDRIVQDLGAE